jgi:hypothetical protein
MSTERQWEGKKERNSTGKKELLDGSNVKMPITVHELSSLARKIGSWVRLTLKV